MQHKRALRLKALSYQLVHRVICRKHHNGVFCRFLESEGLDKVLHDLHDKASMGHFVGKTTTDKVMRYGFYWPTLFKDVHAYANNCPICQKCASRNWKSATPLQSVAVEEPFQQWGLDIIGEIFIKAQPLFFEYYILFHVVERGSSTETIERLGIHQLPRVEYHFQVWCSYVTCFRKCNVIFFIMGLWVWIEKWYFLLAFYELLSTGEWYF